MSALASTVPDVLDRIDNADAALSRAGHGVFDPLRVELREARAAVAELIEADKEYDSAEVEWDALDKRDGLGDDRDVRDYEGPEYARLCRAISRRAAALARIGGAK